MLNRYELLSPEDALFYNLMMGLILFSIITGCNRLINKKDAKDDSAKQQIIETCTSDCSCNAGNKENFIELNEDDYNIIMK